MAAQTKANLLNQGYIHYLIALIIGIALAFALQPANGLTREGVRVIAILVPSLYLWLTTNTHWTSLLLLGMLVMTQVMSPDDVWQGSIGHFAVITLIVFMLLNQCLKENGVIDKIASWFITRKFVYGRPYVFLAMFFASNLVVGMFMENLSLAIIYIGIAAVLCEKIGVKKGHSLYTCIMLGILWGNVILSIASPIAKALPNILIGAADRQLGITITYAQWFAAGVPFTIIMFAVLMLCVRIFKPDITPLKNFNLDEFRRNEPPLNTRGKIAAIVMIFVILAILLPEIFVAAGIFETVGKYLTNIGVVVPAILAAALLSLIRVDGKAIMDLPQDAKGVPLHLLIFTGAVCVMSIPISSEATGIAVWLRSGLQPLIAGMSPLAVVIALVVCALIMTNVVSNVVTMILFFNIGVALLTAGGMNMGAFAIVIAFAASMACCTPSAALTSPMFFGPGHITMQNSIKCNVIFVVLSFVVLIAFLIPFASAIIRT
jgi:sodium-dependent dicarboxylate transporter 2/3/5